MMVSMPPPADATNVRAAASVASGEAVAVVAVGFAIRRLLLG